MEKDVLHAAVYNSKGKNIIVFNEMNEDKSSFRCIIDGKSGFITKESLIPLHNSYLIEKRKYDMKFTKVQVKEHYQNLLENLYKQRKAVSDYGFVSSSLGMKKNVFLTQVATLSGGIKQNSVPHFSKADEKYSITLKNGNSIEIPPTVVTDKGLFKGLNELSAIRQLKRMGIKPLDGNVYVLKHDKPASARVQGVSICTWNRYENQLNSYTFYPTKELPEKNPAVMNVIKSHAEQFQKLQELKRQQKQGELDDKQIAVSIAGLAKFVCTDSNSTWGDFLANGLSAAHTGLFFCTSQAMRDKAGKDYLAVIDAAKAEGCYDMLLDKSNRDVEKKETKLVQNRSHEIKRERLRSIIERNRLRGHGFSR